MKTSGSKFNQCLYFTASALARKVDKLATAIWSEVGLSPSHAYLLLTVLDEPGIQPTALGQQLQLQPSTITRLIEKLEQKKLLIRTTEGKITNVYPTPRGKELQPQLHRCAAAFQAEIDRILGKEEGSKMVKSLGRMADQMDE